MRHVSAKRLGFFRTSDAVPAGTKICLATHRLAVPIVWWHYVPGLPWYRDI
jgi:hypothetical protein